MQEQIGVPGLVEFVIFTLRRIRRLAPEGTRILVLSKKFDVLRVSAHIAFRSGMKRLVDISYKVNEERESLFFAHVPRFFQTLVLPAGKRCNALESRRVLVSQKMSKPN